MSIRAVVRMNNPPLADYVIERRSKHRRRLDGSIYADSSGILVGVMLMLASEWLLFLLWTIGELL